MFTTSYGKMLGTRTMMAWGALEEGIGRTFYDWREVLQRPDDDIKVAQQCIQR